MRREPAAERAEGEREPMPEQSTSALLEEIARRLGLHYGRLEVVFHDGKPSPRVVVEHRLHRLIEP